VVDEGFVLPLLTLDLNPDYFDVAAMPWVEREWQEIGKIVAAVRPYRGSKLDSTANRYQLILAVRESKVRIVSIRNEA